MSKAMSDLFGDAPQAPVKPSRIAQPEQLHPIVRPDGQFGCMACCAPAHFGFGVKLRAGELGRWACAEHREIVKHSTGK
jgi:hypothetical protein